MFSLIYLLSGKPSDPLLKEHVDWAPTCYLDKPRFATQPTESTSSSAHVNSQNVVTCCVRGCNRNSNWLRKHKFYPIPEVQDDSDEQTKKLVAKRRKLWLKRIHRIVAPPNTMICSFHFQYGKSNSTTWSCMFLYSFHEILPESLSIKWTINEFFLCCCQDWIEDTIQFLSKCSFCSAEAINQYSKASVHFALSALSRYTSAWFEIIIEYAPAVTIGNGSGGCRCSSYNRSPLSSVMYNHSSIYHENYMASWKPYWHMDCTALILAYRLHF